MSWLNTLMVGDGTRVTRPLQLLAAIVRHPGRFARLQLNRWRWSERTIVILVMQTLDNAMALRARKTRFGGVKLQTEQDPDKPNPTFIPVANQFAEWLAERTGGIAQSSVLEATASIPFTAHILGGAAIGDSPETGRRRHPPPGLRLREPAGLRRLGRPRQRRRQPVADHHRDGRAGDGPTRRGERRAEPCRTWSWAARRRSRRRGGTCTGR